MTTDHQPPAGAVRLASEAFYHARCEDWAQVSAAVNKLYEEHGDLGVSVLLLGVADTLISARGGPAARGRVVAPAWLNIDDGTYTEDANVVPPYVRWAGQFILARAANDEAMCNALVGSCGSDEEYRECVAVLIECAAQTINQLIGTPS